MDEKQRDLIENIYFQYRGLIYKVAIKYFPGKMEETEEVFAESLKRLCCYAQTVERIPCNKLPQYIVSLTANVCIDRIRDIQKKKETLVKQQIMMAEEPISEDNYDLLFDKSYATELINSFDNLLDREKQLLWMRYVECMDFPEIGDILGMKLVQQAGIKVIIITGRKSHIVEKRMAALGVDLVYQGREDKGTALKEACAQLNLAPEDCLYMGDDWPDLSAFAIAGMKITVPNGHVEVRRRADLVTQAYGGRGAVREICDMLLMSKGVYQELLEKYLAAPL